MTTSIEVEGLHLRLGEREILAGVDLDVRNGETVAIKGSSGSGKSTLLHVMAGLVHPDSGNVKLSGHRIDDLNSRRRSALRLREFGFVFQFGELLPEFNVLESTELPSRLLGQARDKARARAEECLKEVGILELSARPLGQISGGQLQRVAIARAIATEPSVVLADEPTGSLDDSTASDVMNLLLSIARNHGAATVIVTHDASVARRCDRVLRLADGVLTDAIAPA